MRVQQYLNHVRSYINLFSKDEIRYITLTFFIFLTYFTPYLFLSLLIINTIYYLYENYKVDLHLEIKKNDIINDELDKIIKNSLKVNYALNPKHKNNSIEEIFKNDDDSKLESNKIETDNVFDPDYDDMPPLISDDDCYEEENHLAKSKFDEFPSPIFNPTYIKADNEMLKILSSQNL